MTEKNMNIDNTTSHVPTTNSNSPYLYATMETNLGSITIELDTEKAPITARNFQSYVESGFFDGTIFHRVIPGFVIQGGGLDIHMKEKNGLPPIANESKNGLKNLQGSLSMARTSNPHSASSQFFINLVDNPFLDPQGDQWGYAVFGRVISGMDIVKQIATVDTCDKNRHSDVPVTPIIVEKAFMQGAQEQNVFVSQN